MKVRCTICGATILPTTAEATGGICMPCKNGCRESMDASKAYREDRRTPKPAHYFCGDLVRRTHDTPTIEGCSRGMAWPWSAIIEEFERRVQVHPQHTPLLQLSQRIAASVSAPKLYPGIAYDGLLITNRPTLRNDHNVCCITHFPDRKQFRLQYRQRGEQHLEQFWSDTGILCGVAAFLGCLHIAFSAVPRKDSPTQEATQCELSL